MESFNSPINKFLHIIPYAHNGGTEKDCYYIIKADRTNTHEVWVLDRRGPMSEQWEQAGATVDHLDILQYHLFSFKKLLQQQTKNKKWDGIFYWSSIRLPLVRAALKNQSCRLAVHIGNPVEKSVRINLKNRLLNRLFFSAIPTQLFACSGFVQQSLGNDSYDAGFPSKVSLNPVELLPENPHVIRKLGFHSPVRLGMVARLDPIKDHRTVIVGFKRIQESFPNATLELLGDGILRNELEKLVLELGLKGKVIFKGNVSNVYHQIQQWNLFVYATTEKEGLGNVVSEALANGLPCILSDLPMLREIVSDSGSAEFFPAGNPVAMADKAIMLLKKPEKRKEMSENGFLRAKEAFSAERYLKDRMTFLVGDIL